MPRSGSRVPFPPGSELVATSDLHLSPLCRLLVDGAGPAERVYDGGGHRLVLPTGMEGQESTALVVLGAGKTLRLKNVLVVNAASLAAAVHLGAGDRPNPSANLAREYSKTLKVIQFSPLCGWPHAHLQLIGGGRASDTTANRAQAPAT